LRRGVRLCESDIGLRNKGRGQFHIFEIW
jgi:hypothetical protein